MLVCPRCNEPLVRTKTATGFLYVCPQCSGRAVALSVVKRLTPHECVKELWVQTSQPGANHGPGCPVCRRSMVEVPLSVHGELVRLDVCKGCQFVWFDRSELEELPKQNSAAGRLKPLPQEVREQMALADVQMVAKHAWADDEFARPEETWKWIPGLLGMPVECDAPAVSCRPWVTWGVVLALAAVFAATFRDPLLAAQRFGLVPAEITRYGGLTLLTSFFLHAGWLHLVGNAYFLLVFGDNVEDCLGRGKLVALLAAAALAGALLHAAADPRNGVPCVGASCGISGVIVFYAIAFPQAKLGLLIWYWFRGGWLYMPASVALVCWLLLQGWLAYFQVAGQTDVSALGHLGGAAVGLVAGLAWKRQRV